MFTHPLASDLVSGVRSALDSLPLVLFSIPSVPGRCELGVVWFTWWTCFALWWQEFCIALQCVTACFSMGRFLKGVYAWRRGSFSLMTFCAWRSGSGPRMYCSPTVPIRSLWSCYSLWAHTEPLKFEHLPTWHFSLPIPPGRSSLPLCGCSPLSAYRRERNSIAVGCCAQLLIDMKQHYNSYFQFGTLYIARHYARFYDFHFTDGEMNS